MIYTLENEPGVVAEFGVNATPWSVAAQHGFKHNQRVPMQNWQTRGTLAARINHGRWVVSCPQCNSAAAASKIHPEFYCVQCHNTENAGQPFAVAFPVDAEAIEAELVKRAVRTNMNWNPGESLDTIKRENAAHGVD